MSKAVAAGAITAAGAAEQLKVLLFWVLTWLPDWPLYPPDVQSAFQYLAGGLVGALVTWVVWRIPNQTVVS
jgi:hypothetical protein